MRFIGDIHGLFYDYQDILGNSLSIQVGDMGIGFGRDESIFSEIDSDRHRFIRGNHDNPLDCEKYGHYLGNFGIWNDIFYISGGFSIDRNRRIEGRDWWKEEELSYMQMTECYGFWEKQKPDIVCSHECPEDFFYELGIINSLKSSTARFLSQLLSIHKPKLWIFGHHHQDKRFNHKGIDCIGLDELSFFDI